MIGKKRVNVQKKERKMSEKRALKVKLREGLVMIGKGRKEKGWPYPSMIGYGRIEKGWSYH